MNLTGEKGECGYQSEQENNETSIFYFCSMCPANFDEKSSLFKHFTAMHETTKVLECDICNSQFRFESKLKRHVKTVHEKLKPFSCPKDSCDYKAATKVMLKQHIERHTGVKPYDCALCNTKFFNKYEQIAKKVD